jgi:glycosyltransferase involved in cell wall biosynthesis
MKTIRSSDLLKPDKPAKMDKKKILLLTLVHPDFLPPVYATGQVLRDLGFFVHILTFDSFVPAELDLGENIIVETLGRHYDSNLAGRIRLRKTFTERAKEIVDEQPVAVISFCPFSFTSGLKIKDGVPLVYLVLEIADFILPIFLNSPLSNLRNLRALKNLHKADFVATPSIQRSAWLAGRCHLGFMPQTILNTAYLPKQPESNYYDTYKNLVPPDFLGKKVILYTGAVNDEHCILELVRAFDLVNDESSALIITGIKDNDYCARVKRLVERSPNEERIKLFPYVSRAEMLSLQANANIGVCLSKEDQGSVRTKMIAPNKVGEYLYRNLFILGLSSEYLRPLEMKGMAALSESPTPVEISKALRRALAAVTRPELKENIGEFVKDFYCMQQQMKPLIYYLNEVVSLSI